MSPEVRTRRLKAGGLALAGAAAVVALGLTVAVRAGAGLRPADWAGAVGAWARGLGAWGPLAFAGVYVLAVVALVPASALTVTAGALFGPLVGGGVSILGATVGAALAFLIARHGGRAAVARRVGRDPRFAALDRALGAGGWRVVALLRLSPAVPFNLQNYFYGLTRIGFWPCVLTSAVAMLPATFLYAALGHAGRTGLEAASGVRGRSPAEWALLGVGLASTLAITVEGTRRARGVLRAAAGDEVAGIPEG